ncbi:MULTISPECIES: YezD family protein [Bacillaceae]|uniref:DUF2292 domain-containing protein n=1 Tax=Peribacillus huizhouensis TaxID=1501239 RepID=A0ABR6CN25_9BACI|nr:MULTISPECIES: YezD family protein [Bacillaceae]MBA9026410.1 hypothetical protein [Peribacillus huizhouensis]
MKERIDEEKIRYILSTLNQMEYGSVNITVHDGDITQVDITQKKRFPIQKKVAPNGN